MQPEKMSVDCDGDDEEMLKKAIAMSLEEETDVNSAKGDNKHNKFQVALRERQLLRMMKVMMRRC